MKVTNDEDDTPNFSSMRHNSKAYPREENNMGVDSSMSILDDENLCDTIISKNTDLYRKKI